MAELYPRLLQLALLARQYDIGLNIDAEEADRLELSLDLLERLCFEPALAGWNGIGFVIQAYQKRCPAVIDFLVDLARRSRPPADGAAGQGRLLGQRDQARAGGRAGRLSGLHAQGPHRRVLPRLRAQAAGRAATRCSRSSPRTTRRRWPRSTTWPAPSATPATLRVPVPARHGRAALRAGGRPGTAWTAPAASMRRSARTRRCSPTWCAGCWRTAPTPPSSTASPTTTLPLEELVRGSGAQRTRAGRARRRARRAAPGDPAAARSVRRAARATRAGWTWPAKPRWPRCRWPCSPTEHAAVVGAAAARHRRRRQRGGHDDPVLNPADRGDVVGKVRDATAGRGRGRAGHRRAGRAPAGPPPRRPSARRCLTPRPTGSKPTSSR